MKVLQIKCYGVKGKAVLLSALFLMGLLAAVAQPANPVAQLKLEDAEKNYNAGNYNKALEYIEAVEKMVGVTSKTLYLKIVTQDKLLSGGSGSSVLMEALKANAANYLKALEDQPIDDRYRTVYDISKKVSGYSGSNLNGSPANANSGGTFHARGGTSAARQIIQAYNRAAFGSLDPYSIRSVRIEREFVNEGQVTGRITETKALHKMRLESVMAGISSKIIFNNGDGYIMAAGMKLPLTNPAELERQLDSPEKFITGKIDADQLAAASVSSGQFEGEAVDIVVTDKIQYFFSRASHLLVGEKQTTEAGTVILTKYKSYTNYSGLLLPATVVTETRDLNPAADRQVPAQSKAIENNTSTRAVPESGNMAMGLLGGGARHSNKKKQKSSNAAMGFTGVGKPGQSQQGLIALAGELSASGAQRQQQSSSAFNLQTLKGAFGISSSGLVNTATVRIISVQLNVPVSDGDFN